jgi:methionyl-tRNA synthetase
LKFITSQYNGVIPDGGDRPGDLSPNDEHDATFITEVNGLIQEYIDAMDAVKLRLGLQTIMLISIRGNAYLQSSGLGKALMTENPKRCAQVVSRAVNLIYVLSALIYPFMPATSHAILKQLNAPARAVPQALAVDILAGHTIGKPEHLFKKIDEAMAETFRKQFGGVENATPAEADGKAASPPAAKGKKGKAAPAAPVYDGPKTPEMIALEEKITEQGNEVRILKAQTPKTGELDAKIKDAVDVLKKMKVDLIQLQQAAKA